METFPSADNRERLVFKAMEYGDVFLRLSKSKGGAQRVHGFLVRS